MITDGEGQSARLLIDVVTLLENEKITYAVIGAMAASVHGVVRASLDADAVVPLTPQQLGELHDKFNALGFETEFRRGDPTDPIPALLTLADSYGNRVDVLAGLRGLEPEAFSRTVDVSFQGARLMVIGREDFVAMKLFAGGPLDIDDARRVMEVAGNALDMTLLRRLTVNYGADALASLDKLTGG